VKRRRAERRGRRVREMWARYERTRSDDARNALVEAYQGFLRDSVRQILHRLPRTVDEGDIATAANFGLMAAIESFDPSRGVPFESYCDVRIRGAVLDELRVQDWLPRPWRARIEQHKRAAEKLRATLAREPLGEEIARELGLELEEYEQIFGRGVPGAPTGSMPARSADDEAGSLERLPDATSEGPGERLSREELLQLVTQRLSKQEYRIVYLKYWEDLPMREIGELEGLCESRVCKIHARLIERLKERLRAREYSLA
jgi:RNA polymerase sigma factor for flagellar operon FliA